MEQLKFSYMAERNNVKNVKNCIDKLEEEEIGDDSFSKLQLLPIDHTDFSTGELNEMKTSRYLNTERTEYVRPDDYKSSSYRDKIGSCFERDHRNPHHSGETIKPFLYQNRDYYRKRKNMYTRRCYERRNLNNDNAKVNVNLDPYSKPVCEYYYRRCYNEDSKLSNNDVDYNRNSCKFQFNDVVELPTEFRSSVCFEYDHGLNLPYSERINSQCCEKYRSSEQEISNDVPKSFVESTSKSDDFNKRAEYNDDSPNRNKIITNDISGIDECGIELDTSYSNSDENAELVDINISSEIVTKIKQCRKKRHYRKLQNYILLYMKQIGFNNRELIEMIGNGQNVLRFKVLKKISLLLVRSTLKKLTDVRMQNANEVKREIYSGKIKRNFDGECKNDVENLTNRSIVKTKYFPDENLDYRVNDRYDNHDLKSTDEYNVEIGRVQEEMQPFVRYKKSKLRYKHDIHDRHERLSENGDTLDYREEELRNNNDSSLFGDDCKGQFDESTATVNCKREIEIKHENVESSFEVLRNVNEKDESKLMCALGRETRSASNISKIKVLHDNTGFSYKRLMKLLRNVCTLNSRTLYRLKVSARFRNILFLDILRSLIPVISIKYAKPSQLRSLIFSSFQTNLKQYITNNCCRRLSNNLELQTNLKRRDTVKENTNKLDPGVSLSPVISSIETQTERRSPDLSANNFKKSNLLKNVEYNLLKSRSRLINHADELQTSLHYFLTTVQNKYILHKRYDALTSAINQVKEDILKKEEEVHKSNVAILEHYAMIINRKENCTRYERMCSAVGLFKTDYKLPEENKIESSRKLTRITKLMQRAIKLAREVG